ncbi:MAG: gliding motility-associated ABC transporter permease subunit GldF [Saprospiraceae bacterium]|nr:gliding motility-associated ABC transporter permease subunit GldF [Saprospiraceae bacterium]
MGAIFRKEITAFFTSLTGFVVIGVFLVILGLIMWVFPDYSILHYNYATLEQLFTVSPIVFLFLIPAICMRSFSEERQTGTIEILFTKPLSTWDIILGKYFGALFLVLLALIPTILYYYSVYQLGSPVGNIDNGEVMGSYLGLFLLSGIFIAIGIFASVLSKNQIIAFLLAALTSFLVFWGFSFISTIPILVGTADEIVQKIGIDYHYRAISQGVIDTRDLLYFLSVIVTFLYLTHYFLSQQKS